MSNFEVYFERSFENSCIKSTKKCLGSSHNNIYFFYLTSWLIKCGTAAAMAGAPCKTDSEFRREGGLGLPGMSPTRLAISAGSAAMVAACCCCTLEVCSFVTALLLLALESDDSFLVLLVPAAARSIFRFAAEMIPVTISFALTFSRLGFVAFRASSNFYWRRYKIIVSGTLLLETTHISSEICRDFLLLHSN